MNTPKNYLLYVRFIWIVFIEKYKDNFNIWYRSDMMDSMNKVNFNKNLETTQDEMNKVKEAAVKILGQYKNFLIESKIDELEKDFKWALNRLQINLEMNCFF